MAEWVAAMDLRPEQLAPLTNEMIDRELELLRDCTDADVVFEPEDLSAFDAAASTPEETNLAWSLGHIIVHVTASSEEAAAIGAELARGVPHRGGRSRHEVYWEGVRTVEACRARLEESRRMRLASLQMWPDHPDLENGYIPSERAGRVNAVVRFLNGLRHDDDHLEQIREVVRQAHAARGR